MQGSGFSGMGIAKHRAHKSQHWKKQKGARLRHQLVLECNDRSKDRKPRRHIWFASVAEVFQ